MSYVPADPGPHLMSIFERTVDRYPNNIAIICDNTCLTYDELDQQANQLAHYLHAYNIQAEDVVGVLLPRSIECYIAMLALYKIGAIYVPIAEEYPSERINHILGDMNFVAVLTCSDQLQRTDIHFPKTIVLDTTVAKRQQQPKYRLAPPVYSDNNNPTCYVIYTSGSTGKPNGVAVGHHSICHYVTVASATYGMSDLDKVYHGFSLAFDASFEEIWMAFANGATLIIATSKDIRSGLGLIEFLNRHHITVFSTVPTLLANLSGEVASLRLLILGGEVCTEHIIAPWMRDGLQIMNTYGPTEATVVSTFSTYIKGCPITIGKPLPGYEVIILNESLHPAEIGETGELCITGAGLAKGYVNRADITAAKFIPHPLNPDARLYRTGDLAQWNEQGDLVFMGRLDDQVKLRGFRLELNEIETIIMTYPGIQQAVVALNQQDGNPKLVAYFTTQPSQHIDIKALKLFLMHALPAFMLPSIYEPLDHFPLLPSGKVNRKQLPEPKSKPHINPYTPPSTALETKIAHVFAHVLQHKQVSIYDDFFYDLGGHSLTAASIVSQLRKEPECHHLSMLDLYHHRTVQQLAKAFDKPQHQTHAAPQQRTQRTSRWRHGLCAIGQSLGVVLQYALSSWQILVFFLAFTELTAHHALLSWTAAKISIGLIIGLPVVSMAIVIALKWILLGRIKTGKYRLWGWFYWRWWLVSRLENLLFPPQHLAGTPLITLYYRLMGATIGKHCHINTPHFAMHDVISIGDNTAINHEAVLKAYIVENGWMHVGPIQIGSDCYIGTRAVLGIHTHMHAQAGLDDLSMLPNHAKLLSKRFYQGSPAQEAPCPYNHIMSQKQTPSISNLRKIMIGTLQSLSVLWVECIHYGGYALALYGIVWVHKQASLSLALLSIPLATAAYYSLFCSSIILFKRCLPELKPGHYSLYSLTYVWHWLLLKLLEKPDILAMADSLYYPKFLRLLGAKLGSDVELSEIAHAPPELLTIHDHGFVAAYASIAASKVYHGHVFFDRSTIGNESFVGNRGVLPQGAYLHDGGLIGCLSILPMTEKDPIKHATWLGSPAMLLPNRETSAPTINAPLKATMGMKTNRLLIELLRILIPSTLTLFNLTSLYAFFQHYRPHHTMMQLWMVFPFAEIATILSITACFVLLKWTLIGRYKPDIVSIWDNFIRKKDIVEYTYGYFIQSYWVNLLLGTPFLSLFLKALGTKIGRCAYIETASFEEFDLISIGDEVNINSNAIIQTHLYEDRIFKMSHINIASYCNIGRDSIVLYDTTMEPYATLGSLSLLMKGETLPQHSHWEGCPAQAVND